MRFTAQYTIAAAMLFAAGCTSSTAPHTTPMGDTTAVNDTGDATTPAGDSRASTDTDASAELVDIPSDIPSPPDVSDPIDVGPSHDGDGDAQVSDGAVDGEVTDDGGDTMEEADGASADSDGGDGTNDATEGLDGASTDSDGTDGSVCGDALCDDLESCATCPEDCGPCEASSCCEPHASPGCSDATCEATICLEDQFCCIGDWDGVCAYLATTKCAICGADVAICGDGVCEASEGCLLCPDDCGACPETGCCVPHPDTTGCDDDLCETIVCLLSPDCCDVSWDESCVTTAQDHCPTCDPTPTCGDAVCGWNEDCGTCPEDCGVCQSCCEAHAGTGCEDPTCEALVCNQDPFCCNTKWDVICIPIAEALCEACAD